MEKKTQRHWVSLSIDIIVDVPEGLDTETQEGQDYLRAEFLDYIQSAQHISLDFQIGEEDDQPNED